MNDLKLGLVVVRQASLGFFEWETLLFVAF